LPVSRTESYLSFVQGLSSYEAYQQFPEQVARIQALQDEISGGTTAVLALIFQGKLFVANVGDSRALLCKEMPESTLSVEQVCNKFFVFCFLVLFKHFSCSLQSLHFL